MTRPKAGRKKASATGKKPRTIRPATRIRGLAILVVLMIIGYGAVWISVADEAEKEVEQLLVTLRNAGYTARAGSVETGGFPYRLTVTLSDVQLAMEGDSIRYRLDTPELVLTTHPWTPNDWNINASEVRVRTNGPGGRTTTIQSPDFRASYRAPSGAARRLVMDMGRTDLIPPGSRQPVIQAESLQVSLRWRDPAEVREKGLYEPKLADLAIRALEVQLDDSIDGDLGQRLASLELVSEIHGDTVPLPVPEALGAWRDEGGTLEVTRFDLSWGALNLKADGSLSLDDRLRPLGALTSESRGATAAVRHFQKIGLIGPSQARVAIDALVLLEKAAENGKQLDLPIMLQEGEMFLGALPVADVGPVLP